MKKIRIGKNGELTEEDVDYFGGKYSLWESMKRKGVGSPRIIYHSGIEEFDKLHRGTVGEVGFVNFELLKNGLILRLNISQRINCIGIKLDEIAEINLIGYPVEIMTKQRVFGKKISKIVYRGALEIVESDDTLKFSVLTKDFKSITNYFEKDELVKKFNFSLRNDFIENDDEDPILKMMDIFERFFL